MTRDDTFTSAKPGDGQTWIFGYGSLIWRPDFEYREQQPAQLHGWQRRFWQASPDHRGVPQAPGRVVTLVRDAESVCHGMAFLPAAKDWSRIIALLDVRERNGYELHHVEVVFDDGQARPAVTYVAGPQNPSFVGPAPFEEMVEQIAHAHGPSGANREYVLELSAKLADLGVHDDEVHALSDALRRYPA